MEKPAFESPEEKKRKKAEKDSTENQSRFEQLQAALRRALESLLDPPDSESQSAKEPRLKVSRRERIDDGETTYGRLAEPEAAARPYRPVITPYNPEVQARHFSESPEDELSVSPQSQDTQINTNESGSSTVSSESRTAALRERADQIWRQARESVRNFIDRSRITNTTETTNNQNPRVGNSERGVDTASSAASLGLSEATRENESSASREELSGLTIAELEDRFGKRTTAYQPRRNIETKEAANPIVPLYVAFNELRQRRYRKKLERIADEQRKQQRTIDQVERDNRRQPETTSPVQPIAASQSILKRERHEPVVAAEVQQQQVTVEQQSQPQPTPEQNRVEIREGEVRASYPPMVTPRLEQTQTITEPTTAEALIVDESEAEKQRVSRGRSQPAVAIKEVVERHPAAKIEQTKSNSESTSARTSWEQRTGDSRSKTANHSSSADGGATFDTQISTSASDTNKTVRMKPTSASRADNTATKDSVIDTPRWQQAVLIVINVLLIALLVRELVS